MPHLIPTWHKWNVNTDDDNMILRFANPSDVTSGMRNMHGHTWHTRSKNKIGVSKYSSDLACAQADLNLVKITASHFPVL